MVYMPKGYPDWLSKKVGVILQGDWMTYEGLDMHFRVHASVAANDSEDVLVYEVPEDCNFIVTDFSVYRHSNPGSVVGVLYYYYPITFLEGIGGYQGAVANFKVPPLVPGGFNLAVGLINPETTDSEMFAYISGFLIE